MLPVVLSEQPARTKAFPDGHYLVPDTNALLNALDLFEQTTTAFRDVVVLQTVLEELRNRSLPLYNRLVALTRSSDKRFYVFFNDFRLETHVRREPGESINDRNDRAVRRAVLWYGEHLSAAVAAAGTASRARRCPAIVMLTDDKENLRKAAAEGLAACSCALPPPVILRAAFLLSSLVHSFLSISPSAFLYFYLYTFGVILGLKDELAVT